MKSAARQAWGEIGSLALWVVSVALMIPTLMAVRGLFMWLAGAMSGGKSNMWVMSAVDQFGVLIMALAGLLLVLYLAYSYHEGLKRRALWRRFGIATGAQVAIIAARFLLSL